MSTCQRKLKKNTSKNVQKKKKKKKNMSKNVNKRALREGTACNSSLKQALATTKALVSILFL